MYYIIYYLYTNGFLKIRCIDYEKLVGIKLIQMIQNFIFDDHLCLYIFIYYVYVYVYIIYIYVYIYIEHKITSTSSSNL